MANKKTKNPEEIEMKFKTVNELLDFVNKNPEYKPFLDKPLVMRVGDEAIDAKSNWHDEPIIRFNPLSDELIIEVP